MALSIIPFTRDHVTAVKALNSRLKAGGCAYAFPADPVPAWLPPGSLPYQDYRIALDGDTVRGAYILKHELFILDNVETNLACFQLPISEGVVDRRFAMIALRLIRDALATYSKLYALGLGGLDEPITRFLSGAGWSIAPVPFYFKVVRGKSFLRHIRYVRTSTWRRWALDALAISGAGHLGVRTLHWLKKKKLTSREGLAVRPIESFDSWADTIWQSNASRLRCAAVRNSSTLNRLYASQGARFLMLQLVEAQSVKGWIVMLATQQEDHRHFGAMKLGSIVDGLCEPGYERELLEIGTHALERAGVDLIVTNQSWRVFGDALLQEGYFQTATNFFFAASPDLAASLAPFGPSVMDSHLTRGDGGGPIHL